VGERGKGPIEGVRFSDPVVGADPGIPVRYSGYRESGFRHRRPLPDEGQSQKIGTTDGNHVPIRDNVQEESWNHAGRFVTWTAVAAKMQILGESKPLVDYRQSIRLSRE